VVVNLIPWNPFESADFEAPLPADVDHPYGHGRFESVGSLAIGTLLMGVGGSFGASAIAALRAPAVAPLGSVALWAAIVSVVSKEALYQATAAVGRRVRSPVLLANASSLF
jgi:divalent metal cation (Fe/Co/Zn/Cd) transporter